MNDLKTHDSTHNLPFAVIERKAFQDCTPHVVSRWFFYNTKTLSYYVIAKMREIYLNQSISDSIPVHIREYCPQEEYHYAVHNINTSPRIVRHLIPGVVAFATKYDNTSCHEILFRVKQSPVISREASNFLQLLMSCNEHERRNAISLLQENREDLHDITYILKLRLLELADEDGMEISKILLPLSGDKSVRIAVNRLIADFFSIWEKPLNGYKENLSDLLTANNILASLLCTVCILYNISADRLLIHDYSYLAVKSDGSELTETEREYLSIFLRADFATQSIVIANLIAAKTPGLI